MIEKRYKPIPFCPNCKAPLVMVTRVKPTDFFWDIADDDWKPIGDDPSWITACCNHTLTDEETAALKLPKE